MAYQLIVSRSLIYNEGFIQTDFPGHSTTVQCARCKRANITLTNVSSYRLCHCKISGHQDYPEGGDTMWLSKSRRNSLNFMAEGESALTYL